MSVDEIVLFFKTIIERCVKVNEIVDSFCKMAGQSININKSTLVFSPNTPRRFRRIMPKIFGGIEVRDK